jgi:hypothetical protein
MNLKKTLDSGAIFEVQMAKFKVGHRLFKAVMRELKDIEMPGSANVFSMIKNVATGLLSSGEIEAVLWECMEVSLYNNIKVTPDLFEDEKVREDYLVVAKEVLMYNLIPFSKNLRSLFSDIQEKIIVIQKQK